MPYFIFRLRPILPPEKLTEFDSYQQASAHAKQLRTASAAGPGEKIKVMFAADEMQALDLLSQVRTPGPKGDE